MTENINKWSGENPWMGLGAYSEGQRLYGRDKETATLTNIILNHMAIVVYGKSGIGKSSLLKAGVFPLLRQQQFVPIYLRLAHNTDISYVQQIENAISENVTLQNLLPDNIPNLGLWDFLHRNRFTNTEGNAVTPVIVLDQFEEIFTLTQVDHKADIQAFFTELADVLNNVKPDKVIQAELLYVQAAKEPLKESNGFTLQPLSKSVLKYNKSPSFRLVISLRDDSLYLLERNSAKIPALKANRYNLNALDEENAMEVIMKPCSGLFTEKQGMEILNGLAYYEYDDYRIVDPAIISLFLFSYFNGQGKVAYSDIFEQYYQDGTLYISESSLAYIEDHLLTERGNRNQIPYDDLIAAGVSTNEMHLLLQCKILKTEKRKNINYVEFSHDRLCEQALKHRNERKLHEQTRKMRKRMATISIIIIGILGIAAVFFWQKRDNRMTKKENKDLQIAYDSINELNNSNSALNKSLNEQIQISKLQNDALNKQNDSILRLNNILCNQIHISELQNDALKKAVNENNIIKNSLQEQLLISSELLKKYQAQENYIEEIDIINTNRETQKANESYIIDKAFNACNRIRDAILEGSIPSLSAANSELRSCIPSYFNGIRRIDKDDNVLDGHFIYNYDFIDNLIESGSLSYSSIQFEEQPTSKRSVLISENKSVFMKNFCINGNETSVFAFRTRGHQELAVVAEPGGMITIRVHDKTNNVRYNGTDHIKDGRPSRILTFDLPTDKICSIELEITNTTEKSISFVIISN